MLENDLAAPELKVLLEAAPLLFKGLAILLL
ncbi:hypothetical protein YW3DRAFT_06532 [Streptomyces sp. MnatMP-M77]|nr:hypothetical protein YW3DRAFT_06532 [Streptomyces sp. MnatMP-M77]